MQTLLVRGQTELHCTGKLREAVDKVLPTVSDRETLEIICGRWQSFHQPEFLNDYLELPLQHCKLDFIEQETKLYVLKNGD